MYRRVMEKIMAEPFELLYWWPIQVNVNRENICLESKIKIKIFVVRCWPASCINIVQ